MEALIWFGGIALLFAGYLIARIEFVRKLNAAKELAGKAYDYGFNEGFEKAYEDAGQVRRAYMYHFGNRP